MLILFAYNIDQKARRRAEIIDGKSLLVSNTIDLSPEEIVIRYKVLADIERGFRSLKSEVEIGSVFNRLPDRIRAPASVCFMALFIHRVIRKRLKKSQHPLSPKRALESLRRIQRHRITLNEKTPSGISTLSDEQGKLLNLLSVAKPTESRQRYCCSGKLKIHFLFNQ